MDTYSVKKYFSKIKILQYFTKIPFFICIFVILSNNAFSKNADEKDIVNILTWWAYLQTPNIIKETEKKCHVKISFDEYYSNDEFLRRWQSQKDSYDLIIFSDTIYKLVKNKIPHLKKCSLNKQSLLYNPYIKKHYDKINYPSNVVYMAHALTGFLWNPKNITISKDDSILTIFKKAKNQIVVIIDDPFEIQHLIQRSVGKNSPKFTIENFKNLVQESKIYITNNYSQIYKKPEFAFSFGWSGEAIYDLVASNQSYEFLIHPLLSYISSDLLAQITDKKNVSCVAQYLTNKNTLSAIQNKDFYFSPYADPTNVDNKIFKSMYENFKLYLPSLIWIDSMDEREFQSINKAWQLIKLSLNN